MTLQHVTVNDKNSKADPSLSNWKIVSHQLCHGDERRYNDLWHSPNLSAHGMCFQMRLLHVSSLH